MSSISYDDGTRLRVMPTPKDYPDKRVLWHLLPTIDSTAIISTSIAKIPLPQRKQGGEELQIESITHNVFLTY